MRYSKAYCSTVDRDGSGIIWIFGKSTNLRTGSITGKDSSMLLTIIRKKSISGCLIRSVANLYVSYFLKAKGISWRDILSATVRAIVLTADSVISTPVTFSPCGFLEGAHIMQNPNVLGLELHSHL